MRMFFLDLFKVSKALIGINRSKIGPKIIETSADECIAYYTGYLVCKYESAVSRICHDTSRVTVEYFFISK
jgi:hypothetical protein